MAHDAAFYRQLVETLEEGVYFVDRERRITYWNQGAEHLTGFAKSEVEGHHCADNILMHVDENGRRLCEGGCPVQQVITDGVERVARVFLRHKAGHRVPVRVRAVPIRDAAGDIVGVVETFTDNSTVRAAQQQAETLERLALLDPLTGIGNRRYLETQLGAKLDQTHRYGWPLGVVFLDVDHFKRVNDTHGHLAGDAVLRVVTRTMQGSSRSFDAVGRWGGEEFLAALTSITPAEAVAAGERLRTLVASASVPVEGQRPLPPVLGSAALAPPGQRPLPPVLGSAALAPPGQRLHVTVSVGVTCARPDDTLDSLLHRADRLMYAS
ncbi:MAG: diguanylate cyclase, partial [Deferrisomatales bacterium]|nr:diguanylate cyclase [Deferrisomatales bacterium]